jgi:predicted kinase
MIDFGRSKAYDFAGVEFLSKPITGFLENYHAAARDVVANDITMQRENHLKEIWGPITEELKDLGIQGIRDPADQFRMASPEMNEPKYESEANYVLNIMRENKSILPDHLKGFTLEGIEEIARVRGKAAREHAQEMQSRAQTKGGTAGMVLGGLAGHIIDPTMWVGGMVSAPKKAYSLWQLAFYEAMIGAGLGAVQQTSVSQWYKDLGYDYTYKDFVKNVAFDAGAGAVFGVGIKLTADGARAGYRAFKKDGSANAESSAIAEAAQQQQDLEADNPFQGADLPPAQAEHQARAEAAEAAFEDGNLPDIVDEPPLPLKSSKEAAGDEAAKDNLDGVVFAFRAKDVLVDADRFQFKSGGDEFGVSERLQGIKKWNPDLAGDVLFWEDINGNIFIADGHQRRGLAMRVMANDPSQDIKLYGRLKREIDGVSAEKAMVAAAHANIANADNMTSVIDAAKILRLDPEGFEKVGLPPNSATVRQARDMMALSDDAFMSVVNGVIPAHYGAILGRLIDSPELQEAAIKVLSKTSPKNADEAESIIRQVREVDVVQETQVSLFGDEVITESLYLERARVFSRAKALLLQDKKAFESLSRNADRIEAEGNKLVTNQNKRRADQDAQAIHLLQALANRKGTLSDDLTTAAREAKETGSYAKAARSYADAIRRGIERGDFDGATARDVGRTVYGPPKSAKAEIPEEPSLEGFDEPTGPAAEQQLDQMVLDELPEPTPMDDLARLLDQSPTREQIDNHPAVVAALEQMNSKPQTSKAEGYGSDEWHKNRVYNVDGEDIVGTEAALTRFEKDAETLAWRELEKDAEPVAREKQVTIILGPPAAGKSTIANDLAIANKAAILDSDEIKAALPEFDGGIGAAAVHSESSTLAKALQSKMASRGTNIVLPKVGHDASSIRGAISLYKDKGYTVRLVNMYVTPENAYQRMISRFMKKGRIIPPEYLDSVGSKPTATYRTLKEEGIADGYAEIDNNTGFGEPKEIREIAGENPLQGSSYDIPGGRGADVRQLAKDSEPDVTTDLDLEIPVGLLADEEGTLSAATRTMRDIKKDLDAEDAMINRLGVCGL